MKYDESFRSRAVRELRDSGDSVAAVAKRLGIASSTLMRWDTKARASEQDESEQIKTLSEEEMRELEIERFLTLLDRRDGSTRARLQAGVRSHQFRNRVYGLFLQFVVLVFFGLLALLILVTYWYLAEAGLERLFFLYLIPILLTWMTLMAIGWLIDRVIELFSPFFVVTSALAAAEQLLGQDEFGNLVDPTWWKLRLRRRKRLLRKCLRRAENQLSRREVLGRKFHTAGAKEWELANRRRVSTTVAYTETLLELGGKSSYAQ